MTKATLAQASVWLLAIRARFNIKESAREAKVAVHGIAASMIQTYDAAAFRPESQEAISATLKFFREPDIRERLETWLAVNSPQSVHALPEQAELAPISAASKHFYGRFLRSTDERDAASWLNVLRRDEAAFAWVVHHDTEAAGYAVRHHWQPRRTDAELRSEWDDRAGITALARKCHDLPRLRGMLRELVAAYAPQHADVLIEVWQVVEVPPPPAAVELFGGI